MTAAQEAAAAATAAATAATAAAEAAAAAQAAAGAGPAASAGAAELTSAPDANSGANDPCSSETIITEVHLRQQPAPRQRQCQQQQQQPDTRQGSHPPPQSQQARALPLPPQQQQRQHRRRRGRDAEPAVTSAVPAAGAAEQGGRPAPKRRRGKAAAADPRAEPFGFQAEFEVLAGERYGQQPEGAGELPGSPAAQGGRKSRGRKRQAAGEASPGRRLGEGKRARGRAAGPGEPQQAGQQAQQQAQQVRQAQQEQQVGSAAAAAAAAVSPAESAPNRPPGSSHALSPFPHAARGNGSGTDSPGGTLGAAEALQQLLGQAGDESRAPLEAQQAQRAQHDEAPALVPPQHDRPVEAQTESAELGHTEAQQAQQASLPQPQWDTAALGALTVPAGAADKAQVARANEVQQAQEAGSSVVDLTGGQEESGGVAAVGSWPPGGQAAEVR